MFASQLAVSHDMQCVQQWDARIRQYIAAVIPHQAEPGLLLHSTGAACPGYSSQVLHQEANVDRAVEGYACTVIGPPTCCTSLTSPVVVS